MAVYLQHLHTRTPAFRHPQERARDRMKSWAPDRRTSRLIHSVYQRSGIETRYSVCPEFDPDAEAATLYRSNADGALMAPGTAARNAVYQREAGPLAVALGGDLLREAKDSGLHPGDVTHVVFVSCTGFTNPGPDQDLVRQLGLSPTVQRYTLGFMGCYAAFPALRMAKQFCQADPEAVVLVLCLELCTLHLQLDDIPDHILGHSLFADGAAAALVTSRSPDPSKPFLQLDRFDSNLVEATEQEMAWDIGDSGFNLVLSSYVPELIGSRIRKMVEPAIPELDAVQHWAVHPGGRAILDQVEGGLGLPHPALHHSRNVLRQYGNMSSPTILFVLAELLRGAEPAGRVAALAFGPGLTVEAAQLNLVPATRPKVTAPAVLPLRA